VQLERTLKDERVILERRLRIQDDALLDDERRDLVSYVDV
jgi:hypothetical protein